MIGEEARRLDHRRHPSQLELDALKCRDGLSERLPIACVGKRLRQRGLRQRDRECGDRDAAGVQRGEEGTKAHLRVAHDVVRRHPDAVEDLLPRIERVPADLEVGIALAIARGLFGDRHAHVAPRRVPAESHHTPTDICPSVADECFAAVNDDFGTVVANPRLHSLDVRAAGRLREGEGTDRLTAGQRLDPAPLLLRAAVMEERQGANRAVGVPAGGQRLIALTELLHGRHVAGHPDRGSAEFLWDERPAEPKLAHLAEDFGGKPMGTVPFLGPWRDDVTGEVAAHRLQLQLLRCEVEIQTCDFPSGQRRSLVVITGPPITRPTGPPILRSR